MKFKGQRVKPTEELRPKGDWSVDFIEKFIMPDELLAKMLLLLQTGATRYPEWKKPGRYCYSGFLGGMRGSSSEMCEIVLAPLLLAYVLIWDEFLALLREHS